MGFRLRREVLTYPTPLTVGKCACTEGYARRGSAGHRRVTRDSRPRRVHAFCPMFGPSGCSSSTRRVRENIGTLGFRSVFAPNPSTGCQDLSFHSCNRAANGKPTTDRSKLKRKSQKTAATFRGSRRSQGPVARRSTRADVERKRAVLARQAARSLCGGATVPSRKAERQVRELYPSSSRLREARQRGLQPKPTRLERKGDCAECERCGEK